jgi:hypothetical protein
MHSSGHETTHPDADGREVHPEHWWAQFAEASDRFDAAVVVEGLGELIASRMGNPLLRREVQLATETVVRHLQRPTNPDLADDAAVVADRLTRTIERINSRSLSDSATGEAAVMDDALHGRYAAAATAAEALVGTAPLRKLFVRALRLERFDSSLAIRLLDLGRDPADAVRSGALVGQYLWWPAWLLKIITERAVAGTLDQGVITALDNCAYASLTPPQAHLARKLLGGDHRLIGVAAQRLETLGEPDAAERLRQGDLDTVALAVRLMTL